MLKKVINNENDLFRAMFIEFNNFQDEYSPILEIEATKDELSEIYNRNVAVTPIFRQRPEWECSTCRHAIRNVATAFAITDDYKRLPFLEYFLSKYDISYYPFFVKMFSEYIELVKNRPIKGIFDKPSRTLGAEKSIETETGLCFHHFHFTVDRKYVKAPNKTSKFQALKATISKYYLHLDILRDVKYYIEEGAIYRGAEKINIINQTIELLSQYNENIDLDLFAWKHIDTIVAYFNNDVISSLVDDLITGEDYEKAIRSYNKRVAPANYRQPKTIIVSPTQVKETEKVLKELGFDDFVNRFFFAVPSDLSILDVLHTNRKITAKGGLTDILSDHLQAPKIDYKKVTVISFSEFLNLLKRTRVIQVNSSQLEKVVLIKADFEKPLYYWGNNISYSYQSGLADVDKVTQRVKEKGGNVVAEIRFSLYWENLDDLDLHLESITEHIYYGNKKAHSTNFQLDIDMNVSNPIRGAVENIFATVIDERDIGKEFLVYVHNYYQREKPDKVIVNAYKDNKLFKQYEFLNPPNESKINLIRFRITPDHEIEVLWSNEQYEKEIEPETKLVTVDTVLLSPNYWATTGKGNKHLFFLRKGEQIDISQVRPYNIEQLRPELQKHRKVLQLLSNKIQINGKPQLVGYGMSFSKKRKILVTMDGRPYLVILDPTEDIKKPQIDEVKKTVRIAA